MASRFEEKQPESSAVPAPSRPESLTDTENDSHASRRPSENHAKEGPRVGVKSTSSTTSETPDDDEEDEYGDVDDTALGRIASTTQTCTRSRSQSNLPPPPDGGAQAWTSVVAGWLVIFATWGYINSFGAFQSYYTDTALPFQSPSAISWIGSIQAFLTTAIGAFTGRLLDAGYFRPTFAVGAVLQLAGTFAMSASDKPQYWQLMLTQAVLTGLGGGILFTPSLALVATWWGKRRGMAIGLATTGNSTGGILYPLIVRQLIPKVGFAWTARVLGFVNLACLAVALALLRTRLPPRRAGAILDLPAFKEKVYSAYVFGLFFFVWASNYVFYYVSLVSFSVIRCRPTCVGLVFDIC